MATPKTTYVIDLPFSFYKGKVGVIPDNDPKVWKNKILSLLSTGTNERIWYHNYGANLSSLLFETSSVAIEDAKIAIAEVFTSWLPELRLFEIQAGYDDSLGSITVTLSYGLPSGLADSVKITTASLSNTGEMIEVI
jgi:phage baseplate assembly protein W